MFKVLALIVSVSGSLKIHADFYAQAKIDLVSCQVGDRSESKVTIETGRLTIFGHAVTRTIYLDPQDCITLLNKAASPMLCQTESRVTISTYNDRMEGKETATKIEDISPVMNSNCR